MAIAISLACSVLWVLSHSSPIPKPPFLARWMLPGHKGTRDAAGFVATGDRTFEQEQMGFPRRAEGMGDTGTGSWACSLGEDPSQSCCDAVPRFFDIFNGTSCQPYFGVVALALGMTELPLQASIPRSPGDINDQLTGFCPSGCALAVAAIVNEYRERSPLGRLCPMVQDGLWRLSIMCETDSVTPGAIPPPGSTYCLNTYAAIHKSFDEEHSPVTPGQLNQMCGSPCTRKIIGAAVAQAAMLRRGVGADDDSLEADLIRYAARRTAIIARMLDILCSRDPSDGTYCVVKSNILARPDQSLSSPSLMSSSRALGVAGSPVAGLFAQTTTKRLLQAVGSTARDLQSQGVGLGTDSGQDQDIGKLTDGDDFITAMNPLKRFNWVCSQCGRIILRGLMDIADIFGLADPAGTDNPALTPSVIRSLLDRGCGLHPSNRTCLQMLAQSSQSSVRYDVSLGQASQSLSLCAKLDSDIDRGIDKPECSQACTYALQGLRSAYGCCTPDILIMAGITLRSPLVNVTRFATAAEAACSVVGLSRGRCIAPTRRFVATRIGNVKHAWLTANPSRSDAFTDGWRRDLANSVGIDEDVLSVVNLLPETSGVVIITGISAPSANMSLAIQGTAQQVTSSSSVPLVNTVTAVASEEEYSPDAAMYDISQPMVVSDVTAVYAPEPQPLSEESPGGGASVAQVAYGAVAAFVLVSFLLAASIPAGVTEV